jgi:hypothetical protein
VSKLRISPGSHSANTSNGRQHTSQSVVNRWLVTLVSTTSSNACPQNGHWIFPETSMGKTRPPPDNLQVRDRSPMPDNKKSDAA